MDCRTRRLIRFLFRTVTIAIALVLATSEPAVAQAPLPRPTVTRAIDLLEAPPPNVRVGTAVVFRTRSSPAAQRLVRTGLQVRVFAMTRGSQTPVPIRTVEKCHLYMTRVYPLQQTSDGGLYFTTLDDAWLDTSSSQRSVAEGRYFLIVEQAGAPDGEFRLRADSASGYFRTGFSITVSTDGRKNEASLLEAVKRAHAERRVTVAAVVKDAEGRDVSCYQYAPVRLARDLANELPSTVPLELCGTE